MITRLRPCPNCGHQIAKGFGVQCPNCGRRSSSIKGIGALKITKWVLAALVLLLLFIVVGALLYSH